MPVSGGPSLSVAGGLAAAGAELRAHGYDWERVRDRTGLTWQLPFPAARLDEVDTPPLAADERPPVDWLIRLLLLGDAIPSAQLDAFLSAPARDVLVHAGLLREVEGDVAAEAMLLPFEDLLLACDWPWRDVGSRVIVPDPSSALTAEHVAPLPGEPAGTALDVGTGCGIVAFVAARHFARVTGVDISARAIDFARFNAALNARDVAFATCSPAHLERELDAPVDLVTFVMPVLFPGVWRREASAHVSQVEPGADGRELALRTYRQLARALRPGGRALLFHQLPLEPGDDLAAWLRTSGADAELAVVANLVHDVRSDVRARLGPPDRAAGLAADRPRPEPPLRRGPDAPRRRAAARDGGPARAGRRGRGPAALRLGARHDDRTVAGGRVQPPRVALDEIALGADAWALVQAIDGRASVAALGRAHPELDVEDVIRSLARRGLVSLVP